MTATAGSRITYTLTVTNNGTAAATNLVILDTIPDGANYVSGGTKIGNVVSWPVPSLAAQGGVTQASYVVTATRTLTSSSYSVQADGGYQTQGPAPVITLIGGDEESQQKLYLPLMIKN